LTGAGDASPARAGDVVAWPFTSRRSDMRQARRSNPYTVNAMRRRGNCWPNACFRWVPEDKEALALADVVRREVVGVGADEPVDDFGLLLAAGGFSVAEADLKADQGGHEALMFPGVDGLLHIRVDARPKAGWGTECAELRTETRRHRLRFRVAHEVAHSFFYLRTGDVARRQRSSSPGEERFCDLFASALLVPPAAVLRRPARAASVIALHEHYDVSVEVAARALAQARPDCDVALGYWRGHERSSRTRVEVQWASERLREDAPRVLRRAGDGYRKLPEMTAACPRAPRRQVVVVGRRR
jgi:hypothetical protein